MRFPTPIPVSRSPYAVSKPGPVSLYVARTNAGVRAIEMPRLNWPAAPWSVFASKTVSPRRNVQPAGSSARKPGDGVSAGVRSVAAA